MKKMLMAIAIVGTITLTGCWDVDGGYFGNNEKLSAKEIARRKAAAIHGNNKPYTYTWTEETEDGYLLIGKAIVVPD